MRKDSANNKSRESEKEPPNLDSRSQRFTLERVFGEMMTRRATQYYRVYLLGPRIRAPKHATSTYVESAICDKTVHQSGDTGQAGVNIQLLDKAVEAGIEKTWQLTLKREAEGAFFLRAMVDEFRTLGYASPVNHTTVDIHARKPSSISAMAAFSTP